MLFWIVAAALTLAAAMAVVQPFLRARGEAGVGAEADMAVYRDQMAEVGRDEDKGLISPAEAAEARTEIARRLLKADTGPEPVRPFGATGAVIMTLALLAIPAVGWGTYAALGSPELPSQPLAERLSRNPSQNSIDELVARAESHLAENPRDGQAHDVLAPIYMRMGRVDDAVNAYRKAIDILGESPARQSGLGEALSAQNGGRVTGDALAAFDRALALEPGQAKARFFKALALAQGGDLGGARSAFSAIAEDKSADPWDGAAREVIGQIDAAAAAPAPGPDAAQMEAAQGMSEADRKAMIEGMVAQLSEKLKADPSDLEGWKRLVRSYMVMGRADDARTAMTAAQRGLTPEAFAELGAFAAEAGLE